MAKLKEFDFKGFLLEKGERVGLYAAGAIAFLMIVVSLFWPGNGLLSPSPRKKADEMVATAGQKKQQIVTAKPGDAEADELRKVPPELQKQAGNVAEDPDLFRFAGELFVPRDIPSNKRQNPNILGPVEFTAQVVPAEISSYMILNERDGVRIGIVENSNRKLSASRNPFDRMSGMFGPGPGRGGPGGMAPPGGMQPPGGMPGGFDERRRGFGGMMPPGAGAAGGGSPFGEDRKNSQIVYVRKEELAGKPNAVFGRELLPVLMAKVVGAFPLKQQIEEFKGALRAESAYNVVFQETVSEKDKVRKAFDFLGFKVQRRTYGPDGKVVRGADGKEWQDLDLESPNSAYVATVAQVIKEFDPEDPRVAPLLVHGLYLPQPVQISNKDGTPKPYPQIEKNLPKIQQTLEKMKEKEAPAALPPTKLDEGTFNPFGDPEAEKAGPEGANSALPSEAQWAPPDYCVLRFLDLTIQPGQSYEYQVMVRMRNPNFGKPESEVANKQLTTMPELDSEWYPVKGPDGKMVRVSVFPDLHLYAVDQQAIEKESGGKYKGMNANVNYDASRQVPVQIHKWEGQLEVTGKETRFYAVGDWVVGERVFATRGEYLGLKPVPTHVPAWSAEQNQFILAGRPPAKATRGADTRPTEPVSFLDSKHAPLVVDFEAGTLSYRHAAAPVPKNDDGTPADAPKATQPTTEVKSTTGIELLLLTPDGKLIGHSAARDEADKDRIAREKEYSDRVSEAEDKDAGKPVIPGKPGGDPFGGGKSS